MFLINFGLFIISERFVLFHRFFSFGAALIFLNFAVDTQSRSRTHRALFHHLVLSFKRLKLGIKINNLNSEKIYYNFIFKLNQIIKDSYPGNLKILNSFEFVLIFSSDLLFLFLVVIFSPFFLKILLLILIGGKK